MFEGRAELNDGVTIKKYDDKFFIFEDDKEMAVILDTIDYCLPEKFREQISEEKEKAFPFHYNLSKLASKIQPKTENLDQEIVLSSSFMPPLFGVTGLPSPLLQDFPEGNNNGLLIWINGRFIHTIY